MTILVVQRKYVLRESASVSQCVGRGGERKGENGAIVFRGRKEVLGRKREPPSEKGKEGGRLQPAGEAHPHATPGSHLVLEVGPPRA